MCSSLDKLAGTWETHGANLTHASQVANTQQIHQLNRDYLSESSPDQPISGFLSKNKCSLSLILHATEEP